MANSLKEIISELSELKETIETRFKELHLEEAEAELSDLRQKMEDPTLFADDSKVEKVRELQTRIAYLDKKVSAWKDLILELSDAHEYAEIAAMEKAENLAGEIEKRLRDARTIFDKLDLESLLTGPDDMANAFVNIHPGAGGTESQDWADMLLRAYSRYAEKEGFELEMVDYQEGEEAGIKNATLYIRGPNAFGYLKAENGIHRLVRISPFDSNKRRHTSFASVHVSPEISDEVDVEVLEKDLRVDVYRASGAGGQHVNKTESAVRITHLPTGIVVSSQSQRSQIQNRLTCMKMLKAHLYAKARAEKEADIESRAGERKDISWGNQIRSYVFHPYNMVKDLRTGYETAQIQNVMDGELSPFIDAYLRQATHN
ncbi:MAG TPA: peptide chain release factor 2 [Turneriella sp.]|nr:peptide chain release factor 2 [Turneriella sp.]